jgi:AcrR family transcriptional regulator
LQSLTPVTPVTPAPLEEAGQRPLRADARRNYQRLVTAASEVIDEQGPDASLEEIARRAEVGVGTLYRHFPTRDDLLEAVFADQVHLLGAMARDLLDAPDPGDALRSWLWACLQSTRRKHSLGAAVMARAADPSCRTARDREAVMVGGQALLERAQTAGWARPDVTVRQAVTLVCGIALATDKAHLPPDDARNAECFEIAVRGLRA